MRQDILRMNEHPLQGSGKEVEMQNQCSKVSLILRAKWIIIVKIWKTTPLRSIRYRNA